MDDLADATYATKVVTMLLGMYTQKPNDVEIYAKQLIILCTGQPKGLLLKLIHPVDGIAAKSPQFLPGVGEVAHWLGAPQRKAHEERMAAYERFLRPKLEAPLHDDPERKAAALKRWDDKRAKEKKTGLEKVFEPMPEWWIDRPGVTQVEDRDGLRKALASLEAMNAPSEETDDQTQTGVSLPMREAKT